MMMRGPCRLHEAQNIQKEISVVFSHWDLGLLVIAAEPRWSWLPQTLHINIWISGFYRKKIRSSSHTRSKLSHSNQWMDEWQLYLRARPLHFASLSPAAFTHSSDHFGIGICCHQEPLRASVSDMCKRAAVMWIPVPRRGFENQPPAVWDTATL